MFKLLLSLFTALFIFSADCAWSDEINKNPIGVYVKNPYSFTVERDRYNLADFIQIKPNQREIEPSTIKISVFRVSTSYDLSNKDGWQATGRTRMFSLRPIFPGAQTVDIYNTRGQQVGVIVGRLLTTHTAQFDLYEYNQVGESHYVGTAYANADYTRLVIYRSKDDPRPLAQFVRDFANKKWQVDVYIPEIDDRIIRIFAGMILDCQDKFVKKVDENIFDY